MAEENLIKKANHYVDEYADSFGYTSFGNGEYRTGSISFFKSVTEWPNTEKEEDIQTVVKKYNMATIRMPEDLMLKLASFITAQHEKSLKGNSSDEQ